MRNPSMVVGQVVMAFGVNSKTVPVQTLHMNIHIPYKLLLSIQLNQCSRDLASVNLLKRCFYGTIQTRNESWNRIIWPRIHKSVFVGLDTLKFGVYRAVLCFNDGAAKRNDIVNILGVRSGANTVSALKQTDVVSIRKADILILSISRQERTLQRAQKEDGDCADDPEYGAEKH
jgi:hypothetical protein